MQYLVVGGGLMGLAVGERLARHGKNVVILEKAVPGAEASSVAAGILSPRMEAHGRSDFRELGVESLNLYPGWVSDLERVSGLDCGFWPRGLLRVVPQNENPENCKPDIDAIWQDTLPPALAGQGAWWLPEEASVEPVRLLAALKEAALRAGCAFVTGVPVQQLSGEGVFLEDGRRILGQVVICAGAWTGQVVPGIPVRPVRGQVIELLDTPSVESVVFSPGGYMVPRPDGRVLVGATVEEVGFERAVTPEGLSRLFGVIATARPGLMQCPLSRSWCNFRPGTPDDNPILGWKEGMFIASGHFRNGILLAPVTAKIVVNSLLLNTAIPESWQIARFQASLTAP